VNCSAAPTRREQLREVFDAMELEAREEYAEYVKLCGGIPVSKVTPYTVPTNSAI
jgi:hypothetical protein